MGLSGVLSREGSTRPFVSAAATGVAAAPRDTVQSSLSASVGRSGADAVATGRLSLAFLETAIVGIVLFYIWTRRMQGGG